MVAKLYGFPGSTGTRRAAQILHEKKVPFEFIEIQRGEQKSPAHIAKHPFGQVPVFEDEDGLIVFESRAICRYLAAKYADRGAPLVPPPGDFAALARFEQACSIETADFDPHAIKAVYEKVIKPLRGYGETDVAVFDEAVKNLQAKLDVYEVILSKSRFLAGDEPCLADFFHLAFGGHLPQTGVDFFSNRPNLARWFKEINERPSWVAVKDGVKSKLSYD